MRMRISPLYVINGTIFGGGGVTEHEMCVLIFLCNFVWKFLILRRNEQDMTKMFIRLHVKCPLFLLNFKETLIFLNRFSKNPQI